MHVAIPEEITSGAAKRATNFSLRLPQGWEQSMTACDRGWIGRTIFVAKGKLTLSLKNWWYPPPPDTTTSQPTPEPYFLHRLFLWMPRKMWNIDFWCPHCITHQPLRSKGIYNHVRLVYTTNLKSLIRLSSPDHRNLNTVDLLNPNPTVVATSMWTWWKC